MTHTEEKEIPGFDGYKATSDGQIISSERTIYRKRLGVPYSHVCKRQKLSSAISSNGYERVVLSRDGKKINASVHRLVAATFLVPPSEKHTEVNHKNGVKTDNRVENLEWATSSENKKHAHAQGLWEPPYGTKCGANKLSEAQVTEIRNNTALRNVDLAKKYGVHTNTIYYIRSGKRWGWFKNTA